MPHVLLVPGALMPEHEREHFAPDRLPARLARRLQRAAWTQQRFTAPWSDGAAHLAWLADAFAVPGDPPAAIGRYQLIPDRDGRPAYLFDTATGRVWKPPIADLDGDWQEHFRLPKTN